MEASTFPLGRKLAAEKLFDLRNVITVLCCESVGALVSVPPGTKNNVYFVCQSSSPDLDYEDDCTWSTGNPIHKSLYVCLQNKALKRVLLKGGLYLSPEPSSKGRSLVLLDPQPLSEDILELRSRTFYHASGSNYKKRVTSVSKLPSRIWPELPKSVCIEYVGTCPESQPGIDTSKPVGICPELHPGTDISNMPVGTCPESWLEPDVSSEPIGTCQKSQPGTDISNMPIGACQKSWLETNMTSKLLGTCPKSQPGTNMSSVLPLDDQKSSVNNLLVNNDYDRQCQKFEQLNFNVNPDNAKGKKFFIFSGEGNVAIVGDLEGIDHDEPLIPVIRRKETLREPPQILQCRSGEGNGGMLKVSAHSESHNGTINEESDDNSSSLIVYTSYSSDIPEQTLVPVMKLENREKESVAWNSNSRYKLDLDRAHAEILSRQSYGESTVGTPGKLILETITKSKLMLETTDKSCDTSDLAFGDSVGVECIKSKEYLGDSHLNHGAPLAGGAFLDLKDVLIALFTSDVVEKIPRGKKSNVFFVVKKIATMKHDGSCLSQLYNDDISWKSNCRVKEYFYCNKKNEIEKIILKRNTYYHDKGNSIPLKPQPSHQDLIEVERCYGVSQVPTTLKRCITSITKVPSHRWPNIPNAVCIEYITGEVKAVDEVELVCDTQDPFPISLEVTNVTQSLLDTVKVGFPLPEGNFLDTTSLLMALSSNGAVSKVPNGSKSDVYFVISSLTDVYCNEKRKIKADVDDVGPWGKDSTTSLSFVVHSKGHLERCYVKGGLYYSSKSSGHSHTFELFEPQPSSNDVLEIERMQCVNSVGSLWRRISLVKKVPKILSSSIPTAVCIEYLMVDAFVHRPEMGESEAPLKLSSTSTEVKTRKLKKSKGERRLKFSALSTEVKTKKLEKSKGERRLKFSSVSTKANEKFLKEEIKEPVGLLLSSCQEGKPLLKHRFLPLKKMLDIFRSAECVDRAPQGLKQNVYFVIDQEHVPEICKDDRWIPSGEATSDYYRYASSSKMYIRIFKKVDLYVTGNDKPCKQQPKQDEVLEIRRYSSTCKAFVHLQRRVSWIANVPSHEEISKKLACVEYLGSMRASSEKKANQANKKHHVEMSSRVCQSDLRDEEDMQVRDTLRKDFVEEELFAGQTRSPCKLDDETPFFGNVHFSEDISVHPFVKHLEYTGDKVSSLILYTDEQILNLCHFCCCDSSPSVLSMKTVVKQKEINVTVLTYTNNSVIDQLGNNPIFIGPILIHKKELFSVYSMFLRHLREKFGQLGKFVRGISNINVFPLVIGLDFNVAHENPVARSFKKSAKFVCVESMKSRFNEKEFQEVVRDAFFGHEGIAKSSHENQLDDRIARAKSNNSIPSEVLTFLLDIITPPLKENLSTVSSHPWVNPDWTNNLQIATLNLSGVLLSMENEKYLCEIVNTLYEVVWKQFSNLYNCIHGNNDNLSLSQGYQMFGLSETQWSKLTEEEQQVKYLGILGAREFMSAELIKNICLLPARQLQGASLHPVNIKICQDKSIDSVNSRGKNNGRKSLEKPESKCLPMHHQRKNIEGSPKEDVSVSCGISGDPQSSLSRGCEGKGQGNQTKIPSSLRKSEVEGHEEESFLKNLKLEASLSSPRSYSSVGCDSLTEIPRDLLLKRSSVGGILKNEIADRDENIPQSETVVERRRSMGSVLQHKKQAPSSKRKRHASEALSIEEKHGLKRAYIRLVCLPEAVTKTVMEGGSYLSQ